MMRASGASYSRRVRMAIGIAAVLVPFLLVFVLTEARVLLKWDGPSMVSSVVDIGTVYLVAMSFIAGIVLAIPNRWLCIAAIGIGGPLVLAGLFFFTIVYGCWRLQCVI